MNRSVCTLRTIRTLTYCFVISVLLGQLALVAAQQKKADPPKEKTKRTKQATADDKIKLKENDRIVFLGDSITQAGNRPGGYVSLVRDEIKKRLAGKNIEVIGAGISGNKVPDLQRRLQKDVLDKKPTHVVIYIGINDVWHSEKGRGTDKDTYESGLKEIIGKCKSAGADVILCTPTVIGEKSDGSNKLDEMLEEYSTISRQVARATESNLLDLRKSFLNRLKKQNKDQKKKGIFTTDGVHLNKTGNEFVAGRMLSALNVRVAKEEAPSPFKPTKIVEYKKVGKVSLKMHLFEPKDDGAKTDRPAIVFFFGGGWVGGKPSQFYPHCDHLAKQGIVAMAAEYRVKSKHGTSPFECVKDGKSAIRWVRANAADLRIDPNLVAAGGGSAGGHVAAATGTVPGLDEEGEDTANNARPNALVLFNPVFDNGPDGWGHGKVKDRFKEISPAHNIDAKTPPAIIFLGTKDKLIPVAIAENFVNKMKEAGVPSTLNLYEGAGHGFFNFGRDGNKHYDATVKAMDEFMKAHGFLEK